MKVLYIGVLLIILGILSGIAEAYFYGGHLDENNIVQESFFLPLSYILTFLGLIFFVFSVLILLYKHIRDKKSNQV